MRELITAVFADMAEAEQVLGELRSLETEGLVELRDAAVAVRDFQGDIAVSGAEEEVAAGTLRGGIVGGLCGALVGARLAHPALGFAAGGAIGAGTGSALSTLELDIPREWVEDLATTLRPGSSAISVMVESGRADELLARMGDHKDRVSHTTLSVENEAKLRAALGDAR